MKIVIFIVLALLLGGGTAIAMFPMSMAAEYAAKQVPDFHYSVASGSVWSGKLTDVSFGEQKIGNLAVKTDALKLFTGKAGGHLDLSREGFTGQTGIAWPIGGKTVELSDLKLAGKIAMVPGMPQAVAAGGGMFSLDLKDLKLTGDACEFASGEVWTDALAKVNHKGWVGPELRGPVTCTDGKIHIEAAGKAVSGENVIARMSISPKLDMEMTASVLNAQGSAVAALTNLGFKPEGNALVMRQALGS
jgi:hypothetical protein